MLPEIEIRQGGRLHGTLIQEGRAASGGRRELFTPGSVEWPATGVGILTRHRAAPELRAVPERQPDGRITVEAPATPAIRAAIEEGRRFMSVEFRSLRERTTLGGVREVLRAFVPDVALVHSPEYDTTRAELRRRIGRVTSSIARGTAVDCRCADGCTESVIEREAVIEIPDSVIAIRRGYAEALASKSKGTLQVNVTDDAIDIELDLPNTTYARDLLEAAENVPLIVRPVVDFEFSEWVKDGATARFSRLVAPAFVVGFSDMSAGHQEAQVEGRRRVWL